MICVIGDGLAGNLFVRRLLELRPATELTVFGAESEPAYNRVLLPDVLAGRTDRSLLALPSPRGERLNTRTGGRVTRIDRERRLVHDDSGGETPYDDLVIATGARPIVPDISFPEPSEAANGEAANVHTLRTMADLDGLQDAARRAKRAIVVGGGLLGVQSARALSAFGLHVELFHQGPHLLDHRIDETAGAILQRTLTSHGIEVHTGTKVRELDDIGGDDVLVLLACGVEPATDLAVECGLAVAEPEDGGGVLVDGFLRSVSDVRIHAIGDCAAPLAGAWSGLAGPALAQAEYLARRLAGGISPVRRHEPAGSVIRLVGEGLDLAVLATPSLEADRTVRLVDPVTGSYRLLALAGTRVQGAVLIGEVSAAAELARLLDHPLPLPADPVHLLLRK